MNKNVRFEDVAYRNGFNNGLAIGLMVGVLATLLVLGLLKFHGLQTGKRGEARAYQAGASECTVDVEYPKVLASVDNNDGSSTVTFTAGGETHTRVFRPLR